MISLRLLCAFSLGAVFLGLGLAGCPPRPPAAAGSDAVRWHLPPGQDKVPLVLLLEESPTGPWSGPNPWLGWLLQQGIAVGQIRTADQGPKQDSGRQDWLQGGCTLPPAQVLRDALEIARRDQPRIDTARFAVLGAGPRGTAALNSARAFQAEGVLPAAIFALYPGCAGRCPTDYAADGPTQVHIFYGSQDDWGRHRGTAERCRQQAGGRIVFHSLRDAGHGFDEANRFTEVAEALLLRHQPDAIATAIARSSISETLLLLWKIDN